MLSDQGAIAFSEPMLTNGLTESAKARWDGYPTQDREGVLRQVTDAGFNIMNTRLIKGAPWAAYYSSLQKRVDALRAANISEEVAAACRDAQAEISHWKMAPDDIAYLLVVAKP